LSKYSEKIIVINELCSYTEFNSNKKTRLQEKNEKTKGTAMKQFELLIQYQHCFGKTLHSQGTVTTEKEAREWVKMKNEEPWNASRNTPGDPVCTCTASFCQFKFQRPSFAYREIETPATDKES